MAQMAEQARRKYQSIPANEIELPEEAENKFTAEALQQYRT